MKTKKLLSLLLLTTPILFALSFVLTIFAFNIGELSLEALALPLVAVLSFAVVVAVVFRRLWQDPLKATLSASIFILLFFSYGDVILIVGNFHLSIATLTVGKNYIFFPIWIAFLLASISQIRRMRRMVFQVNKFLLVVAVVTSVLSLSRIGQFEAKRLMPGPKSQLKLPTVKAEALAGRNLPDIYFIVPEDYSAPAVLDRYFGYHNRDFFSFLTDRGFYLAPDSTSNYPKSFLSVASMLNMEYLDYLANYKNSSDETIVNPLIADSNVLRFLKSIGYSYYQMGSWWGPTSFNELADENFTLQRENLANIGEFNYAVLSSTMLRPFLAKIITGGLIGESEDDKRDRTLYQFSQLPVVVARPGPKFVFVHIMAPHEPYVFDEDCLWVSYDKIWWRNVEYNYIDQVNCVNSQLEKAIEAVISKSVSPPVILLVSDEGAPFLRDKLSPPDSWIKADRELLKEKFPILSAYYLPGVTTSMLYPSITPVNAFRVVFNLYFATSLPLLPDKNYIFPDSHHYYDLQDVTDKVKS